MSAPTNNTALGWISIRHLQHFVARGQEAGLPVTEWLAGVGVSATNLNDGDGLMPLSTAEDLLTLVSRHLKEPLLGLHLAHNIQPANWGVLGYVFQASTTVADILDVLVRFNGLLSNIGKTEVVFLPGTVEVRWGMSVGGSAFRHHATDYVLAAAINVMRLLVAEPIVLRAVYLPHKRPESSQQIRKYFSVFQCPVHFEHEYAAIVLPLEALKINLRHGDATIKELMEHHAHQLMRQRKDDSHIADEVKRLVAALILERNASRDMVAKQLGLSGRSLHRKLQQSGSSYQEILDEVRFEMACQQLTSGNDSLATIAARLDFNSHQAFLRWFRTRSGVTPGEYRKQ